MNYTSLKGLLALIKQLKQMYQNETDLKLQNNIALGLLHLRQSLEVMVQDTLNLSDEANHG